MSADVMGLDGILLPRTVISEAATSLFQDGSTRSRCSRSGMPLSEPSYKASGAKVALDCLVSPRKSALPTST
eukprot:644552-Pleurochrysis_carterae.AAC.2